MEDTIIGIENEAFEIGEAVYDAYPSKNVDDEYAEIYEIAVRYQKLKLQVEHFESQLKAYLGPIGYGSAEKSVIKLNEKESKQLLGE